MEGSTREVGGSQSEWLTGGGVWYECLACHMGPQWHDQHKQAQKKINDKQNAKRKRKKIPKRPSSLAIALSTLLTNLQLRSLTRLKNYLRFQRQNRLASWHRPVFPDSWLAERSAMRRSVQGFDQRLLKLSCKLVAAQVTWVCDGGTPVWLDVTETNQLLMLSYLCKKLNK